MVATRPKTFSVPVHYGPSLLEQVGLVPFASVPPKLHPIDGSMTWHDWRSTDGIVQDTPRSGKETISLSFPAVERIGGAQEALEVLREHRLRAATLREQLAFRVAHPNALRGRTIVAFGSVWFPAWTNPRVAYTWGTALEQHLYIGEYDHFWADICLAGVVLPA